MAIASFLSASVTPIDLIANMNYTDHVVVRDRTSRNQNPNMNRSHLNRNNTNLNRGDFKGINNRGVNAVPGAPAYGAANPTIVYPTTTTVIPQTANTQSQK